MVATPSMYRLPGVRAFMSWAMFHTAGEIVPCDEIRKGAEALWTEPRFRLAVLVYRHGAPDFTNVLPLDTLATVERLRRLREQPMTRDRNEAVLLLTEEPWFRTRFEAMKAAPPYPEELAPGRVDAENPWAEVSDGQDS